MPAFVLQDVRPSLYMPAWQVSSALVALILLFSLVVSTFQNVCTSKDGCRRGPSVQHIGSCSTPSSSTFEKGMDTICWSSWIDSDFGSCAGRSLWIETHKFCDSIIGSPFELVCYVSLRQATTAQHRRLVIRLELRQQYPYLLSRRCGTDNGGCKFCSQYHLERQ